MQNLARAAILGFLAATVLAGAASAQYYPPPYAPEYAPPPQYAPPPAYYPPSYYQRPLGFRCDARVYTQYGRQPYVCDMIEGKPLGAGCVCPTPPPAPGYPPGQLLNGRTIR